MQQNLEYSKTTKDKISRSVGHIQKIKDMIDDGRSYMDVLIQLSAVRGTLNGVVNSVLSELIETQLVTAIMEEDTEQVAQLNHTITKFLQS